MRTAIVLDVHGNLTALEAVVADLSLTSPDLVFHGGDLADTGSSPVEVVDLIRSLGWRGIMGNTDEMLTTPAVFESFAARRPALENLWRPVREMAAFTREKLGGERLAWLSRLPQSHIDEHVALVHASPGNKWESPSITATDEELASTYRSLPAHTVVYGHVHTPFIRRTNDRHIANSGSVGQSYDGDRRAAYLLIDDNAPSIRRVPYDRDRENNALVASGLPHAEWVKRILETASPQIP